MSDKTDPANYWPGPDGFRASEEGASLIDAIYAVAAELRTANHLTYLAATQSNLSPKTLAPIRRRLGFPE